ncbi:MAG: alpha/beta fold hydrolase [Dehalococcoidia bacterium]|nr:alpha/beta fold hydrolase [Dehalococcoidia bacterium]
MERKISFYSSGLRLSAVVYQPDTPSSDGYAGVVLCHGPGGTKENLMPQVAGYLVKAGYSAMCFDYRGWGESEGKPNRIYPMEQAEDVINAITALQQQPNVNQKAIGLWGAATGGSIASYVSAIDSRVRCMVSVSGMGDLGRWLRSVRRYWEWKSFLERLDKDRMARVQTGVSELAESSSLILRDPVTENYVKRMEELHPEMKGRKLLISLESVESWLSFRPELFVGGISPRAAMWICAGLDTLVPVEESISMYSRAGEPKKLLILQEEHHSLYQGKAFEKIMTATVSWFNDHLLPEG